MAFKQLFVKDYGGVDEDDYSTAVFTQQDLYNSVSYVMEQVVPAHTFGCFRLGGGGRRCDWLTLLWDCLQRSYCISHRASMNLITGVIR